MIKPSDIYLPTSQSVFTNVTSYDIELDYYHGQVIGIMIRQSFKRKIKKKLELWRIKL